MTAKKPVKITDKMRLDWLTRQDRMDFTGYSALCHGQYVRFSARFEKNGLRRAIDDSIRAGQRGKS